MLKNIKDLNSNTIEDILIELREPKYRAEQILKAIYNDRVETFEEMTTLPKSLRDKLPEYFQINSLELSKESISSDRTTKLLFGLNDGNFIESVLIPSEFDDEDEKTHQRNTLCISTQVGCKVDCPFCATGKMGFKRNLLCSEIVDQFFMTEKFSENKVTNIVFMGMGEPLLNFDNTVKSISLLTNIKYQLMSKRRITVSTAGIVPKIIELADTGFKVKLAVSLHATTNILREKLIPIAKKWNMNELFNSLEYYYQKTKVPITFEYILFEGLNDKDHDVERLSKLTRRFPSKINLLQFNVLNFMNSTGFANELKPAGIFKIHEFSKLLAKSGVTVRIRKSSGKDIEAACGQLAYSSKE